MGLIIHGKCEMCGESNPCNCGYIEPADKYVKMNLNFKNKQGGTTKMKEDNADVGMVMKLVNEIHKTQRELHDVNKQLDFTMKMCDLMVQDIISNKNIQASPTPSHRKVIESYAIKVQMEMVK